jgi:Fe-S-cluster containining protein
MQDLHDEFKRTDCLKCANCCKTTGPLFTLADIERRNILNKTQLIAQYLRVDEDQDYVQKCTLYLLMRMLYDL